MAVGKCNWKQNKKCKNIYFSSYLSKGTCIFIKKNFHVNSFNAITKIVTE